MLTSWISDWSWGKKAAAGVVRDAHNFSKGHANERLGPRVARLAKTHNNLGNAERTLEAVVTVNDNLAPTRVPDSLVEWVLPPDIMFEWLQTKSPRKFQTHLGARPQGVENWWSEFRRSEPRAAYWALHPWLRGRTPADLKYMLPS